MIGHALRRAHGPDALAGWDRPIAAGFGLGSICFLIGPFPGVVRLIGAQADAALFFVGSIFFTLAALLELWQATARRVGTWAAIVSWWGAATQFAGTILFNISTYDAMDVGSGAAAEDKLIWAPDAIGSALFLASGLLAWWVAVREGERDRSWWMAAVNLGGCVLFAISAVGAYIVPSSGSMLDLAAANWGTSLGAACFLAGAVMLWPRPSGRDATG